MKKSIFLLLAVIFMLCGCSGAKEIDERNFVLSGGIDKGEKKTVSFTAGCTLPDTSGNNTVKSIVLDKEENSLAAAMERSGEKDTRSMYFGHLKTFVIGRDFFEGDNLYRFVDYVERENDISLKTAILYTEATAKECIEKTSKMDEGNNLYIWDYYKNSDENEGAAMRFDFDDITKSLRINDTCFIPRITIDNDKAVIGGGCVVKNGEYLFEITKSEAEGYLFISENCKGEILECEIYGETVAAEVKKCVCKPVFIENEDGINCVFEMEIDAELKENNKDIKPELIKEKMKEAVEEKAERLYRILKSGDADAFNLCDELRKENKFLYEKYGKENAFKDMNISAQCDFNIVSAGLKK